jgi:hypothetical protein
MRCTWIGCDKVATHEQFDRDGKSWANLCDEHNAEIEKAIDTMKPGVLMSAWIKAQGGSGAASRRMMI